MRERDHPPPSWEASMSASIATKETRTGRGFVLRPRVHRLGLAVIAAFALTAFASPPSSLAAPPMNDNFDNATAISLPFTDSVDLSEATTEPGEPFFCGAQQTVWYSFTPAS